jgi:AraC-like DNA-binding protein
VFLSGLKLPELIDEARKYLTATYEKLCCIDGRLARTERMLEYEYGRALEKVRGPALDGPEFIQQRRLTQEDRKLLEPEQKMDFTSVLGKPATRGEITNLGTAAAAIYFVRLDEATEKEGVLGPYILPPGTTRAITRITYAIEIVSVDGSEVWVQADVQ